MPQLLTDFLTAAYGLQKPSLQAFGNGLIHATYRVEESDRAYILQRFNRGVFPFPDRIASNLARLKQKLSLDSLPFQLPLPKTTLDGKEFMQVESDVFRLYDFVDGKTIEEISAPYQAFLAAQAYGLFANVTAHTSVEPFQETIPDFHRLDLRFQKFQEVASSSSFQEEEIGSILRFYLGQKPLIEAYRHCRTNLPLRLTHNDTKLNNLIFSNDLNRVEALIDLDTIMPGYVMYDFGDLVRTVACTQGEMSRNWAEIGLNLEVFEQLLKGYSQGIGSEISTQEQESLLLGGEVMTCMMGLRFLTDHLQGNRYYRVDYPERNLHRATNQMIFLKDQQAKRAAIREIWARYSVRNSDNT